MDSNAQASAEFILLFGGIIVVVLLVIYFYKIYLKDFSSELSSKEVNEFNYKINDFSDYFK